MIFVQKRLIYFCFSIIFNTHLPQIKDKLRIATISRNYCWKGLAPNGSTPQVDLILEWDGERTDYLCEIKFSEHEFTIDKSYEKELANKIDGFINSKQHKNTHSVQLVMITTSGTTENEHYKDVNQQIKLDDLFKSGT